MNTKRKPGLMTMGIVAFSIWAVTGFMSSLQNILYKVWGTLNVSAFISFARINTSISNILSFVACVFLVLFTVACFLSKDLLRGASLRGIGAVLIVASTIFTFIGNIVYQWMPSLTVGLNSLNAFTFLIALISFAGLILILVGAIIGGESGVRVMQIIAIVVLVLSEILGFVNTVLTIGEPLSLCIFLNFLAFVIGVFVDAALIVSCAGDVKKLRA